MNVYDPATIGDTFDPGGWQRGTRCGPDQGDCVEIHLGRPDVVALRDTKLPDSPVLVFTTAEWAAFTRSVRDGDFTH